MKTRHIASGIAATIGLLGALGITGCGADVGTEGASGEGAEIGSTSEALTVNGTANKDIQFFGSIKLHSSILNSNNHANTLELVAGGLDSAGNPVTKIAVYDSEGDTLTQLRNAANTADIVLPTALGEPVIAQIPGETLVFLITSGRTTVADGAPSAASYILTLALNGANQIASATITTVTGAAPSSGRVYEHKGVKQCGAASNKKLIAFGGTTSQSGWQKMTSAALSATDEIVVFTYNAANPANSSWATLKDGSNRPVKLNEGRGYPEVFDVDATNHDEFFVGGGLNANAFAVKTVDRIVVNSSCVATNAVPDGSNAFAEIATPMPTERARFTSARMQSTVSGVVYDFVASGGNGATLADGTAYPTALFQFDPDGTTNIGGTNFQGKWLSTCTFQGRAFPRAIEYSNSLVKIVSGIRPKNASERTDPWHQTSKVVETFNSGTTASGVCGTDADMSDDRVGTFADLLNDGTGTNKGYVGLGAKHSATLGTPGYVTPTSMGGTVLVVP